MKNHYLEFDLDIPNDIDEFIKGNEPVILDELPDLEIFSNGKVIDIRNKSVTLLNKNGYATISYKGKSYMVHRLVAKSYLKNKHNYDLVNHIDGNRGNNDVRNLEWVNNTINTLHGLLSVKVDNWEDLEKYGKRSNGINGWISLTSKGYRNFIKRKIIEESFLDKRRWIFSHKTPLFLLFLPLIGKFGNDKDNSSFMRDEHFDDVVFKIDDKFFKNKYKLSGLDIENNNNLWLIVECINKYLTPKNQDDHLLNILNLLKIDIDDYIDFLFYDLKLIIKHDVGFIFFEEFFEYINQIRNIITNTDHMTSEFGLDNVYAVDDIDLENTIEGNEWENYRHKIMQNIRDEKSRDISVYEEKYGQIIDYNYRYHRIAERLKHVHIRNVKRSEIENDIMLLMTYWVVYKR